MWGEGGAAWTPGQSRVPSQDSSARCPPSDWARKEVILESRWLLDLPVLATPTCTPTTAHSLKAPGTWVQVGN